MDIETIKQRLRELEKIKSITYDVIANFSIPGEPHNEEVLQLLRASRDNIHNAILTLLIELYNKGGIKS